MVANSSKLRYRSIIPHSTPFVNRWLKPPVGIVKVNYDATLLNFHGSMRLAWVAQNHEGHVEEACSLLTFELLAPSIAEGLCVREALGWIKGHVMVNVQVETYSLLVAHAINANCKDNSVFGSIIGDCVDMICHAPDLVATHVYKSANRVTHFLARASISKSDLYVWGYSPPQSISFLIF